MDSVHPISRETVRRNRGWLTALGILLIVLGVVSIASAFLATLAGVLLFAVLLLFAGVAQLGHALSERDDHFGWNFASGLLYLVAGGLLVLDPVSGAVGLTLLLAVFFFFLGALRLSLAQRVRSLHGSSGTLVLTGILDLVLGGLIVLGWPAISAWVIGLFLGIELLSAGISLLMVSRIVARKGRQTG